MKSITKSALSVVSLVAVLAGCQPVGYKTAPAASTATAPATAQAAARQPATVSVFAASNAAIKGYRAVRLNDKQTVYVSTQPLINRGHITGLDVVQDKQNRTYVKMTVNPQGAALLRTVPNNRGFATVVGGQLVSLTGVRQGSDFLFSVANRQAATSVIQAIVPQVAATPAK